jgi:hypothetical protein
MELKALQIYTATYICLAGKWEDLEETGWKAED